MVPHSGEAVVTGVETTDVKFGHRFFLVVLKISALVFFLLTCSAAQAAQPAFCSTLKNPLPPLCISNFIQSPCFPPKFVKYILSQLREGLVSPSLSEGRVPFLYVMPALLL